jgi:hypothetical protein
MKPRTWQPSHQSEWPQARWPVCNSQHRFSSEDLNQSLQNVDLPHGTQVRLHEDFKCVIGTKFGLVSPVIIVSIMRAGWPGTWGSIPKSDKKYFSAANRRHRLRDPSSVIFSGCRRFFAYCSVVKSKRTCTYSPQYAFLVSYLTARSDNISFTYDLAHLSLNLVYVYLTCGHGNQHCSY